MLKGGRARVYKVLTLLPFLLTLSILAPSSANAHASIITSTPKDGENFPSSPKMLSLEFSEAVKTNAKEVRVLDGNGKEIKTEFALSAKSLRSTVTLTPKNKLKDGSYILSWKAVSNDGHLVGGGLNFSIGKALAVKSKSTSGNQGVNSLDKYLEGLSWLGLILLFGLILTQRKQLILLVATLGIVVNATRFYEYFKLYQGNPIGIGSVKAIILSVVASIVVIMLHRKMSSLWLQRLALLVVVIGFSLQGIFQGHVLDLSRFQHLGMVALIVHLASAQIWMGSVLALALEPTLLRYHKTRNFSTLAIIFLAISGSIVSYLLLSPYQFSKYNTWQSLFYIKITFLLLALSIGALHHFTYEKKFIQNINIKKGVYLEIGVMLLILLTTTWLVSYSPPVVKSHLTNNIQEKSKSITKLIKFDDGSTGKIEFDAIKTGIPTSVMITFTRPEGVLITTPEIDLFASNPKLGIQDLASKLSGSMNHYMGLVNIPTKGLWQLRIQIMVDDFTMIQSRVDIEVV